MKKLLVSLAVILMSFGIVNAQSKEAQAALKSLDKAKALVAKKGDKADSWLKLAEAYRAAYDVPFNGLAIGTPEEQAKLFLKGQYPFKSENIEVSGSVLRVDSYPNKEIYYDNMKVIKAIRITKPVIEDEDLLAKSMECYLKAKSLNVNEKDFKNSIKFLANDYWDMAMTSNILGDFNAATTGFEKCYEASKLMGAPDTNAIYYGAIMATLAKQPKKAIELSEECMNLGHTDGNLYAMLAENYKEVGDTDKAKKLLAEGYTKFPESQEVLVQLINTYLDSKEDTEKVFDFLHAAQKNEPTNGSLYYSEGNIYREMKEYDKALEMYKKAREVDPTYFYGAYALGDMYYTIALDLQDKAANEMDDAKYNALNEQLSQCLKNAIEPFTNAYDLTDEKYLKSVCAEYLKNIYFRFKDESEENSALYEKYTKLMQENNTDNSAE